MIQSREPEAVLVEELTVEKSESLDPRLCSFCQWVVNLLGLC